METARFRITGLDAAPFRHLYGLSDDELATHRAKRFVADARPGFPDRIALRDAEVGEAVLLVNHTHLSGDGPYRASHAIFVLEAALEGAVPTFDAIDEIPEVLRPRTLSLRAFDRDEMIVDADLVEGRDVETAIAKLLARPDVAFIHAHFAKRGCYACRIDRAARPVDQNSSASSAISDAEPARAVRIAVAVSGSSFAK